MASQGLEPVPLLLVLDEGINGIKEFSFKYVLGSYNLYISHLSDMLVKFILSMIIVLVRGNQNTFCDE